MSTPSKPPSLVSTTCSRVCGTCEAGNIYARLVVREVASPPKITRLELSPWIPDPSVFVASISSSVPTPASEDTGASVNL